MGSRADGINDAPRAIGGIAALADAGGCAASDAGCLGLAVGQKKAAEIDDEPVNEPSPEPPPQSANRTKG